MYVQCVCMQVYLTYYQHFIKKIVGGGGVSKLKFWKGVHHIDKDIIDQKRILEDDQDPSPFSSQ